ncbi:hypothetical protein [Klebsiella aerogenes]|uniref:hypothetical protein n=1 Tax=Klebsiella TaxID=570 RepID=UPI002176062B|nr:hypothetical protein [Klebsiella aerogenes]HBN0452286.1 hypothetical protein [Escherichia coli]UWC50054.1 hypothetical protein M5S98_28580 [Klebsiella aerogenes]HBN0478910.1 hypothetical protein [Escherichia coli]HBN0560757.1 hypothetical protein [Escherichia coli]HBN0648857.1 hypothetical protein [Escherichia coli]
MFGFVKKAVNAVSDTASSALSSASKAATSASASISDKASSTYSSISDSAEKITGSVSGAAQSAWLMAESVITDGLLDLTSDFLKDDEKIREVSLIFWQRIPREVRFFLSEDKFHERTKSLRDNALLKLDESKQKRILIPEATNAEDAIPVLISNEPASVTTLPDGLQAKNSQG